MSTCHVVCREVSQRVGLDTESTTSVWPCKAGVFLAVCVVLDASLKKKINKKSVPISIRPSSR